MHYLRRRFHIFSVDVMAGADIRILGSITGEWERHAGNRLQDYGRGVPGVCLERYAGEKVVFLGY